MPGRTVKSKISPTFSSIGISRSPVRISGPLMSIMIATSRPTRWLTARMRRMTSRVQSCFACAMLRRTMSAPARSIFSSISSLSVAGPSVKMILVRRNEAALMSFGVGAGNGPRGGHATSK